MLFQGNIALGSELVNFYSVFQYKKIFCVFSNMGFYGDFVCVVFLETESSYGGANDGESPVMLPWHNRVGLEGITSVDSSSTDITSMCSLYCTKIIFFQEMHLLFGFVQEMRQIIGSFTFKAEKTFSMSWD